MKVRFWGTRGSLPVSLTAAAVRAKLKAALTLAARRRLHTEEAIEAFLDELPFAGSGTYGGASSCVQVEADGGSLILDAGSGLRGLGGRALAAGAGRPRRFDFLLSHVHWDHIMGFPFFAPAYIPDTVIRIHGCHEESILREAFQRQQSFPCFPVEFGRLGATIEFEVLEPGRTYPIAGFAVTAQRQQHPYDSYGYRIEREGRSLVFSTDSEHKEAAIDASYPQVAFVRDADLLIFDAQYSLADAAWAKEDWGHSSNIVGVEIAQLAGVRHLVLFHHEPAHDDAALDRVLQETARYEALARQGAPLRISAAYDGLEIDL